MKVPPASLLWQLSVANFYYYALYSQFGFSPDRWRLFADGHLSGVFVRLIGCAVLFFVLILWKFKVHTQADPGAGARVFVVCQGSGFQAGVGRRIREGHHNVVLILMVRGPLESGACVR